MDSQFIGNVIYTAQGVAGNVPFAAAYAYVPVVIMAIYLLLARRARRVRGALMARVAGASGSRPSGSSGSCTCRSRSSCCTRSTTAGPSRGPSRELTTGWYERAFRNRRCPRGVLAVDPGGPGGDRHRARAGVACGARGPSLPVLRPRDDLVRAGAAARAAGHHHGHRADATIDSSGRLRPARSSSATRRSALWWSTTVLFLVYLVQFVFWYMSWPPGRRRRQPSSRSAV